MFNEGNQIHNFKSSSGSGTVINYGSGSDFLTSYGSSGSGSGSGSTTLLGILGWLFAKLQQWETEEAYVQQCAPSE